MNGVVWYGMICDMRNSEKPAVRGGEHNAENRPDWAVNPAAESRVSAVPGHQQKEEYFARYASSSTLARVSLLPSLLLVTGIKKKLKASRLRQPAPSSRLRR